MGTRNITAVMSDGEYKIAQYGQWDGYPKGQGLTVLEFCRRQLATAEGRAAFKAKLAQCRFITEPEHERLWTDLGIDAGRTFVTLAESDKFKQRHPQLDRDMAAKVLGFVMSAADNVFLNNEIAFVGDSLFCEWAYVIDLDQCVLEAFIGFNKQPLDASERFASAPRDSESDYFQVRRIRVYALDQLPSDETFCAECEAEK